MGRRAVITAAQSYLTAGINAKAIPYLSKVFDYAPRLTQENEFYEVQTPGTNAGALIFLWIPDQSERRVELRGAPPGGKMRTHELNLVCFFRGVLKSTSDAERRNDEFLDGLVEWIEADKTWDSAGVIFSAGEGTGFDRPDIKIRSTLPRNIHGATFQTFSTAAVTVLEFVPN